MTYTDSTSGRKRKVPRKSLQKDTAPVTLQNLRQKIEVSNHLFRKHRISNPAACGDNHHFEVLGQVELDV